MRIIFAGTPDFSVPPLQDLAQSGFKPQSVLTQPDRRAGRGLKLQMSPVKLAATAMEIPVFQPESLKTRDFQDWLEEQHADLMIVVAYGLILPREVLDTPRFGCWNIHASLLPRWRGAAPIQRAIEAGDTQSGVCIMQMDAGLDTGAVLASASIPLAADETGGSLHDRLASLGAESLLQCVRQLAAGRLPAAIPQATTGISYARKLDKAEAEIDWSESAEQLERRIRAFNPWPVCWSDIGGERCRIWKARAMTEDAQAAPGTVLKADSSELVVACGQGQLHITQLQRPGGKPQSAQEFLQNRQLPAQLGRSS
ncbi:MAG TPA: methionyl-tRNA formyltransferase [Xanthomonadales bacterium]|nr:methionyl-tRNA formyltransferase [Xanthomonadales bacterium]